MRTEIIEETKNTLTDNFVGAEYVYHYIEYKFLKPPKEVRITKYRGGRYDGNIQRVEVIHKDERFSRHVQPRIPYKKQLLKIPFKPEDFVELYHGIVENVEFEHEDNVLLKNGVSKETIENLYYMKIAEHYNKINEYYIDLDKRLKAERDRDERELRELRELQAGSDSVYHENLDEEAEWRVINDAWQEVPRATEEENEEDEESEYAELEEFFDDADDDNEDEDEDD